MPIPYPPAPHVRAAESESHPVLDGVPIPMMMFVSPISVDFRVDTEISITVLLSAPPSWIVRDDVIDVAHRADRDAWPEGEAIEDAAVLIGVEGAPRSDGRRALRLIVSGNGTALLDPFVVPADDCRATSGLLWIRAIEWLARP